MTLELYFHPLASYCWKALVALYENATPFTPHPVDLGDPRARAELTALWPFAKFPVLHDHARDRVVPESTSIIEYLSLHHPGTVSLIPRDPGQAFETRAQDRFFDVHVHESMQRIVGDRLRADGQHDPVGVEHARGTLAIAYTVLERVMASRTWAIGDAFTLADCAAAPALYYADRVAPLGSEHPVTRAYLARLLARPSFERVLREATPYLHLFPAG